MPCSTFRSEATDDGREIKVNGEEELPRGNGVHHEHPLREIVDRDRVSRAHNGQRDGESSSFVESGDRKKERKDRFFSLAENT